MDAHALRRQGWTISAIARHLGRGRKTIHAPYGTRNVAVETRTASLVERGMSMPVAEQVATEQNETMGRAVLALYRSAAQPVMAELGHHLEQASQRPGLALIAAEDHMVGTDLQRRRAARRAGARVATLEGLGHWCMTQDPARGARALTAFWAQC
ncbi:hypothetical protein [Streptomyces canus]|uniref:hypothetical protein n=1 Tax=Streptomyces canus TaxID=58343 RepID=UPI00386A8290